jgi:Rrf2 family transcriptional regulator, iron-sulfur cluster assembly transcription factor
VDLSLTWRGDYVVRAAVALAAGYEPQAWLKAGEIAEKMAIPRNYVAQILTTLVRADLVETRAGRQGGYRLREDPASVSLLAVVEAGEGELASRRCVLRGSPCGRRGTCAIHDPWLRAQQALRAELEATPLALVAASASALGAGR